VRIAYAILVHRNPPQVARLIRALTAPDVVFCLHVDRKTPQEPFEQALLERNDVKFVERRACVYLASYRIVEAALRCFELALSAGADVIVLLSGQDYPLRAAPEICAHLSAHANRQFIDYTPIGPQFWPERINHFYFNSVRPLLVQRMLNKAAKYFRRRRPDIPVYGGSAWVSVNAAFTRHLLATLGNPTTVRRYLRFTHVPEELAIQTVALNSPFAQSVVNDNLRHIRWKPNAAHPDVFTIADFNELVGSGKLFARKFDLDTHPQILDRLDAQALRIAPRPVRSEESNAG
jgi:hypothetical protein